MGYLRSCSAQITLESVLDTLLRGSRNASGRNAVLGVIPHRPC